MKKKLLTLFLVFAMMLTVGLAGCSKPAAPPAKESVFKWNIGADPKTIDPVLNGASDGGDVINQTFEGLTREKR